MKIKRKTKKNNKHYPTWILAVVLSLILLLEGTMVVFASSEDWSSALDLFVVDTQNSAAVVDMEGLFEPVEEIVNGINKFYASASVEMEYLLSGDNGLFQGANQIISMSYEFYTEVANEMMALLDVSKPATWAGQVAGAYIEQ